MRPRSQLVAPTHRPFRAVVALMLVALSAASLVAQAAILAPTPSQTEGPFYPRTLPSDHDNDLTQIAGRSQTAQGTRLYLTGRVLATDGAPVSGVTVELWQCDSYGRYHHVGDDRAPRDDAFQGYGTATTDADGRFSFKTIRPVAYSGRIPHLHFKLRTAAGKSLTTQLYVKGDSTAGDPVLAMSPPGTQDKLGLTLAPASGREPGALEATFDFVLR
jgi:protocatechuate 3,4-dioxygenase beta subunit